MSNIVHSIRGARVFLRSPERVFERQRLTKSAAAVAKRQGPCPARHDLHTQTAPVDVVCGPIASLPRRRDGQSSWLLPLLMWHV